jgi:hypothetical protein
MRGLQLQIAARYLGRREAEIAAMLLEAEGIPVLLADECMTRLAWLYSIAFGGTRLIVPDERLEEARALLTEDGAAVRWDDDSTGAVEVTAEETCPVCNSGAVAYSQHNRRLRALSMIFLWFRFPVVLWGKQLSCGECGHEWSPSTTTRRGS